MCNPTRTREGAAHGRAHAEVQCCIQAAPVVVVAAAKAAALVVVAAMAVAVVAAMVVAVVAAMAAAVVAEVEGLAAVGGARLALPTEPVLTVLHRTC